MNNNSIFIPKSEMHDDNNKITYTDVMEAIPKNSLKISLNNWQSDYQTEWRWRFLKFNDDKKVIEISYINNKSNKRIYYNQLGKWVERYLDPIFNQYVIEQYYYYT